MDFDSIDTDIPVLGDAKIRSPIGIGSRPGETRFVEETERVLLDVDASRMISLIKSGKDAPSFELAGPRKNIYFDPSKLRCAIVTCGGMCPGLNDIIRAVVLELHYCYGVKNIYGIRYGLQGFIPEYGHDIVNLVPDVVVSIHEMGGSILGSSRGPQPIDEIVDALERQNISILFMVGGDGTLKAAAKISDEIMQRGLKISVIGIPKTIDNDIYMVSKSFGFDTAVDVASQSVTAAHNEAEGYPNGIGLIKLMGRHSGFIAATTTLAKQDVNFVLIPEVPFDLNGPKGFLPSLEKRLKNSGHAVIVVAEGAGQDLIEKHQKTKKEYDASGNLKLLDIGKFLKEEINRYFQEKNIEISLKYIDPSYLIRSLPANANDNAFCSYLGRDAVHAGLCGKTRMLIGYWNDHFVHVPISATIIQRKQVLPHEKLWRSVLDATGQPSLQNDAPAEEEPEK